VVLLWCVGVGDVSLVSTGVAAVGRPVEGCGHPFARGRGGHDGLRCAPVGGVNQRGRPRLLWWGS